MPYVISSVTMRDLWCDLKHAREKLVQAWGEFNGPLMMEALDNVRDIEEVLDAYAESGWRIASPVTEVDARQIRADERPRIHE